jgi:hypothetical protein
LRHAALAGVALAAVLGLSACGGLPGSGPVVEGGVVGEVVNDPVIITAQGPVDGASKEAIIRGFLRAAEDKDETHQTGKLFLTPKSQDLWRWSSQEVVVYNGDLAVRDLGGDRVEVSAPTLARVTPDGRYIEQPAGARATVTFGMTKVGGQWRIQLPPEGFGMWLNTNQFDRVFINQNIYFVTKTGRDLVPDSRWFPNGSRLATTIARAQLAEVPDHLAGAVVTGVPARTQLAVNAVPVDNGRALVSLTSQALSADPDARTRMWAQLAAALSQVPTVISVSLAVDNTTLELPNGVTSVSSPSELGYDMVPKATVDTALLRRGDQLVRIDPRFVPDTSTTSRRPDTKPQDTDVSRIPANWRGLALSVDSKQVAAVSSDHTGLSLWRATTPARFVAPFAASLTRPAFDATGYLWVGGTDHSGAGHLYVFDSASSDLAQVPKPVAAPWLANRRVVAVAVAPDSARLLVVTSDRNGNDRQLGLTGIIRSVNGEPMALTAPLREAQSLSSIQDVTWMDAMRYAVLGQPAAGQPVRPWLGTLGAGIDAMRDGGPLAPVPGATSITTVGGPRGLIIITSDNRVFARTGSIWRQIQTGSDVLVPGG